MRKREGRAIAEFCAHEGKRVGASPCVRPGARIMAQGGRQDTPLPGSRAVVTATQRMDFGGVSVPGGCLCVAFFWFSRNLRPEHWALCVFCIQL